MLGIASAILWLGHSSSKDISDTLRASEYKEDKRLGLWWHCWATELTAHLMWDKNISLLFTSFWVRVPVPWNLNEMPFTFGYESIGSFSGCQQLPYPYVFFSPKVSDFSLPTFYRSGGCSSTSPNPSIWNFFSAPWATKSVPPFKSYPAADPFPSAFD